MSVRFSIPDMRRNGVLSIQYIFGGGIDFRVFNLFQSSLKNTIFRYLFIEHKHLQTILSVQSPKLHQAEHLIMDYIFVVNGLNRDIHRK